MSTPDTPRLKPHGTVKIRAVQEMDLPDLVRIVAASPTAPQWTERQFHELLPAVTAEPASLMRAVLVAETQGCLAGFAVVSALRVVFPAEAELESIAVTPEFRGLGIGRALLEAAVDWAGENGAEDLRLEVRMSNLSALGLYRVVGFRETGTRRGYYANPSEDAICMAYTIQPAVADDVQER